MAWLGLMAVEKGHDINDILPFIKTERWKVFFLGLFTIGFITGKSFGIELVDTIDDTTTRLFELFYAVASVVGFVLYKKYKTVLTELFDECFPPK